MKVRYAYLVNLTYFGRLRLKNIPKKYLIIQITIFFGRENYLPATALLQRKNYVVHLI